MLCAGSRGPLRLGRGTIDHYRRQLSLLVTGTAVSVELAPGTCLGNGAVGAVGAVGAGGAYHLDQSDQHFPVNTYLEKRKRTMLDLPRNLMVGGGVIRADILICYRFPAVAEATASCRKATCPPARERRLRCVAC